VSVVGSLGEVLPAEALSEAELPEGLLRRASAAEAVVRPATTEEVVEAVRWASANQLGVLPVGSGSRLWARPGGGRFIILATDRLAGFEIYEPADLTFTAKPGTRLADVNDTLGRHHQWLPFDPPSFPERTLGGLVASGESGPVATGYGELRSHVLGATLVCGDGRVLRLGGRVVKNVAGFDLLRPLVGSRGRLGVITSLCLRAFPVPAVDRLLVLQAGDVSELEAVTRAVRTAPVLPASVVLWAPAARLGGEAALFVRLQGAAPTVDADRETLERHAGVSFAAPEDAAAVREELRDRCADGPVSVRITVLPSRLFDALKAVRRCLGDVAIVADAYGGSARTETDAVDAPTVAALRGEVEALGGALVAHGAPVQSASGSQPVSEVQELENGLERVFDPEGVLWPCRVGRP